MIEGFDVKEQVLGTGDTLAYTFDFKIYELTDLLIYVQDGSGVQVEKIRGDDTSYLAGVTFDALNGGGTVTLAAFLPDTYVMTMLLANDQPDQTTSFPNKGSFTLDILEGALDFLASCIQRVSYLAQRAMVLNDLDDATLFDPTLPLGIMNSPGGIVSVKGDGTGFEVAITTGTVAAAQGYATTATAAASSATASAAAAAVSAAAAAAAVLAAQTGFSVLGARATPINITAAGGVVDTGLLRQMKFIHGSPGAVTVSANPQISHVSALVGSEMTLIGCDDTNTVKITNGNGVDLNGDCTLGNGDTLGLTWDGTNWSEIYRRAAT